MRRIQWCRPPWLATLPSCWRGPAMKACCRSWRSPMPACLLMPFVGLLRHGWCRPGTRALTGPTTHLPICPCRNSCAICRPITSKTSLFQEVVLTSCAFGWSGFTASRRSRWLARPPAPPLSWAQRARCSPKPWTICSSMTRGQARGHPSVHWPPSDALLREQ